MSHACVGITVRSAVELSALWSMENVGLGNSGVQWQQQQHVDSDQLVTAGLLKNYFYIMITSCHILYLGEGSKVVFRVEDNPKS